MSHSIQRAPTGRSKCRACKQTISKGELRLGEEVPNSYGEGTAVHYFHVACGARQRAGVFLDAWEGFRDSEDAEELSEDAPALIHTAELGQTYYRLQRFVRVERAPSGRARCQGCRELIEKGALRFVLQRIEDGIVSGAGFVHVECAHAYAGAVDELEQRVAPLSELDEESFREVKAAISRQSHLPRVIKVPYQSENAADDDS